MRQSVLVYMPIEHIAMTDQVQVLQLAKTCPDPAGQLPILGKQMTASVSAVQSGMSPRRSHVPAGCKDLMNLAVYSVFCCCTSSPTTDFLV